MLSVFNSACKRIRSVVSSQRSRSRVKTNIGAALLNNNNVHKCNINQYSSAPASKPVQRPTNEQEWRMWFTNYVRYVGKSCRKNRICFSAYTVITKLDYGEETNILNFICEFELFFNFLILVSGLNNHLKIELVDVSLAKKTVTTKVRSRSR